MRKILIPTLLTLSLVSCAQTPARKISSETPKVFLHDFDSSLKLSQGKNLVNELVQMRYYAQARLNAFDDSLAKDNATGDLLSNPAYTDLLETRAAIDAREQEIVSTYVASRNGKDFGMAAGIVSGLSAIQQDPVKKMLADNLLSQLHDSIGSDITEAEASFTQGYSDQDLFRVSLETKADLDERAEATANDKTFSDTLDGIKKEIGIEPSDSRKPQSIGPGTGPSGNLTGREFAPGVWALTFDDGPSAADTPGILGNLSSFGYKATFFELAKNMQALPAMVGRVKGAGHEIGNHSFSHPQMTKLNDAGLNKEIVISTQINTKIAGQKPRYFRLPYGAGVNNARIRSMIAAQGMVHVFWNVDSLDWQDHNPASIANRVRRQMAGQGRGIILFHDIHAQTIAATRILMTEWKSQGKRMMPVGSAVQTAH